MTVSLENIFKSKKEIPELTHTTELTSFVLDEMIFYLMMKESEVHYRQVFMIVRANDVNKRLAGRDWS